MDRLDPQRVRLPRRDAARVEQLRGREPRVVRVRHRRPAVRVLRRDQVVEGDDPPEQRERAGAYSGDSWTRRTASGAVTVFATSSTRSSTRPDVEPLDDRGDPAEPEPGGDLEDVTHARTVAPAGYRQSTARQPAGVTVATPSPPERSSRTCQWLPGSPSSSRSATSRRTCRRCSRTLRRTERTDVELLLVDDHSRGRDAGDRGGGAARRSRTRACCTSTRRPGSPPGATAGVDAAAAPVVTFLDGDDWIAPGYLDAGARAVRGAGRRRDARRPHAGHRRTGARWSGTRSASAACRRWRASTCCRCTGRRSSTSRRRGAASTAATSSLRARPALRRGPAHRRGPRLVVARAARRRPDGLRGPERLPLPPRRRDLADADRRRAAAALLRLARPRRSPPCRRTGTPTGSCRRCGAATSRSCCPSTARRSGCTPPPGTSRPGGTRRCSRGVPQHLLRRTLVMMSISDVELLSDLGPRRAGHRPAAARQAPGAGGGRARTSTPRTLPGGAVR